MVDPLFPVPSAEPVGVAKAAIDRVRKLQEAGLLEGRHEVPAAMVKQLAQDMAMTHKAYALANLSKALLEALELLPVEPGETEEDPMMKVRAILLELREGSGGWEPTSE